MIRPHTSRLLGILAIALLLLAWPMVASPYQIDVVATMVLYLGLAVAYHVLAGYGGQMSIGHSGLFGVGAYTSAILLKFTGLPFWVALGLAGAAALVVSAALIPAFRVRGIYFAILTFGITEILRIAAINLAPGGALGITSPPQFDVRGNGVYYVTVWVTIITLVATHFLMASPLGIAIQAVRDDEWGARAAGVPALRIKALALGFSAFFTGVLGATFALRIGSVDPPNAFSIMINLKVLLMGILGGIGTFWGPVTGAAFISLSDELLRTKLGAEWSLITFALLLIVLMLAFPNGLGGIAEHLRQRRVQSAPLETGSGPRKGGAVESA